MASDGFAGFPEGTIDFLRAIAANNTKSWFEAHREDYQRFYVEPAGQFVLAAGPVLRQFAPEIQAEPRVLGSIFRINRDTRFSKDKRPYKDHLDFWFWEGERRAAVSGFFVRISPDFVGIGAGCHGFGREQLTAFRAAIADAPGKARLAVIADELAGAGYRLFGDATPRSRFLYVHVDASAEEATRPSLLPLCAKHWQRLSPLHRWLIDNVQRGGG